MIRLFLYELRRLFRDRNFRIILCILIFIGIGSAFYSASDYLAQARAWETMPKDSNGNLLLNVSISTYSFFNSWLGGLPTGFLPILFYSLLPVFVSIPYAASCLEDKNTGYIRGLIAQYGRRSYYICRFATVFISGALTVLIPLAINMLLTACLVPFRMPDPIDNLYFQVYYDTIGSSLYYTVPWLYDLLYLFIDGVFAGTWAVVCLACSFYTASRLAAIIVPYIGLLYLSYAGDLALKLRVYLNVQPLELIRPIAVGDGENGWVLFAEIMVMLAGSFIVVCVRGKQDDIY